VLDMRERPVHLTSAAARPRRRGRERPNTYSKCLEHIFFLCWNSTLGSSTT
jgi:hypothetical protein